jgi:diacylglycerol kinase (ATP)
MVLHNIEIDKVPLAIIPFGTGNDFSRVLGWGGTVGSDLIGKYMEIIKNMIR